MYDGSSSAVVSSAMVKDDIFKSIALYFEIETVGGYVVLAQLSLNLSIGPWWIFVLEARWPFRASLSRRYVSVSSYLILHLTMTTA